MTLATILDSLAQQTKISDYEDIDRVINISRPLLFSFNYNYYNPAQQEDFEKNFLKNFYFHEIGFETYGRFKLQLESLLLKIMPYYNYIFHSSKNYDLFSDVDIVHKIIDNSKKDLQYKHKDDTTTNTKNNTENFATKNASVNEKYEDNTITNSESNAEDSTNSNSNTLSKTSEYPQSELDSFESNKYLSNLQRDTNTTTSSSQAHSANDSTTNNNHTNNIITDESNIANIKNLVDTINSNEHVKHEFTVDNYTRTLRIKGKNGGKSYIELLFEYNQLISNLDAQIMNECSILFMGVGFYD